ncbi:beta-lactamase regulating signal transducer with metallopeptidase domain [Mucilaginibacter frigoritolerans]|uniref:Beta-lactamase regulating signal transducer with metallopeptidase domain n=1 Tax=Mucilaginibacter frigoritolerans TaxID=652788 RepID=A0A562U524_9SPHI|nr:M56 family metallopeptidase [Mucilaginibacter frigoritolerans]TWJ00629.1 beta-lactamase regulating signal transducer with metallopeptidase domain [Mucilaginibacter frigoritolerans]
MKHIIDNLFSDHLMTAISSTLIHSLWQGAVLSAVIGLVMTCTPKASSAKRYNLLVGAMTLFAVAVAGTFIIEFNNTGSPILLSAEHPAINPGPIQTGVTVHSAASPVSIIETISSYLNRYAASIVWIWLLIMCVRCVQLTVGLRGVYNLRHKNISAIGSYWEERAHQLCVQLGIKRLVGIAQSARIKTPVVIGHFKPLVLIPVGMFTSLSVEEAEAILLHELAHIRRTDYLINLLQSLMEIVFFFNPAVLWLSALIKAERENCCDDMALLRSSKVNYIKALVACEEYNQPFLAYAMALRGNHGSLKNRVNRIISNKNLSLNSREKSLLAACLIATGIFATAFTNGEKLNKLVISTRKRAIETLTSSNNNNKSSKASSYRKDNLQQVKPAPNEALSVAEVAEPAEQLKNKTDNNDVVQHDTTKLIHNNTSLGKLSTLGNDPKAAKNRFEHDADQTNSIISDMINDGIVISRDNLSFKIGTDEFVVNYKKQPEDIYKKYRTKYVPDQQSGDWTWYYQFDQDKYAAINKSSRLYEHVANQYSETANAYNARAADYYSRTEDDAKTDADRTNSMISDLMKDGIITSPKDLSFKIGNNGFIVNYKKQAEEIYQKYRAKYVADKQNGNWGWYYRFDENRKLQ